MNKFGDAFLPEDRVRSRNLMGSMAQEGVTVGDVLALLAAQAQSRPLAPCAVGAGITLTYHEVDLLSERLASVLRRNLGASGGVISIYGARRPQLTVALLATMKAGFAFNILDPKHPWARIAAVLEYVKPTGVISLEGKGCPKDIQALMDARGWRNLWNGDLDSLSETGDLDSGGTHWRLKAPLEYETTMYVAFTSGTTGSPKAVWGAYGPVGHFLAWQQRTFAINHTDRVSVLSGLSHDPLLRDLLSSIWAGGSSWFPPESVYTDPGSLFDWMHESKISIVHVTPSLLELLLATPRHQTAQGLCELRVIFAGGEPLTYRLAARVQALAPNAQIVNCYGATETPQVVVFNVIEPGTAQAHLAGEHHAVPIGKGIDDVNLLLLDSNDNHCADGTIGEICIQTPHRALRVESIDGGSTCAYGVNPLTHQPDDMIYRTGDVAILEGGLVRFLGRRDRQVKIRGFRIDLSEIETAVRQCSYVREFHVDISGEGRDTRIVLFLTVTDEVMYKAADIRAQLASLLPTYMVPDKIMILLQLPRNANGKVDRSLLLARLEDRTTFETVAREERVLDIREQDAVSSITQRLRSLHVFADGRSGLASRTMDSLQIVEMACVLEEEFLVRINPEQLRRYKSMGELARHILTLQSGGIEVGQTESEQRRQDSVVADTVKAQKASWKLSWMPQHEAAWAAVSNRVLQLIARVAPDALRVRLHRWRKVQIGRNVSIGYDTIIETAFPWLVRIGDSVNIGMRVTIIGHFRGMEDPESNEPTVVIEDEVFIGPGAIILPNVTVGRGAVVAAGSVVTAPVPAGHFVQGNPAVIAAVCGLPLTGDTSYQQFLEQLRPFSIKRGGTAVRP